MTSISAAASLQPARPDDMESLVKRLDADPNDAAAHARLYALCLPEARAAGMKASAINRLIAVHPEVPGLRSVALMLCRAVEEYEDRLLHLEALHRHGVNEETFYREYAVTLKNNGHFARALAVCGEGLAAYPESAGLRQLRAHMHLAQGQPEKALADWTWIAVRAPDDRQAQAAIGNLKLLLSDGREGYAEYAAHSDLAIAEYALAGPLPEWRGENLRGKHLLLWSSQGIGDIVMFAGFLPWARAQGAQVTLALYPKTIPLFARSFPGIRVVLLTNDLLKRYAGECDFHTILEKLMCHAMPGYVPAQHPPYLTADAEYIRTLRQKYRALSPVPKKLVGISWFTKNPDTFSQRNIALEQWEPLFALPQVQYVSLQYGDHAAEIDEINRRFPGALLVDPEIDAFEDMDALTAQIAAMDEVVSIQNATVHLAGALGVKTTLMLSAASEWRWGLERSDNRWYKSVTVERQEKIMEWKPVLMRVRDWLAAEDRP